MRHERISEAHIAAAAWPSTMEGLVLAEPASSPAAVVPVETAPAERTAAAPDVPAGVGGLIVAAYAGMILMFFAFFTGSLLATMVVTISAGFVVTFFTIPRIFFGMEPGGKPPPSLNMFMDKGLATLSGHCSGRDALVQMLLVPVLLTLGLLAMGIAGAIYL